MFGLKKSRRPFSKREEALAYFANPLNYGIEVHSHSSLYEDNAGKVFLPLVVSDKGVTLFGLGEISFDDLYKHFVWVNTDTPVGINR